MPLLDRFEGLLDDARVYSVALSDQEVAKIYNGGEGDMGLVGVFTAPAISSAASIPISLQFQRFEETVAITGLEAGDLNVTGASVSGFSSPDGNLTFAFNLIPDANVTSVRLNVPRGAGSFGGDPTLLASLLIRMVPPIQAKDDLVNWWWLDDARGTSVLDSIYPQVGELKGQASWSTDAKFGSSLAFQQAGDYADLGLPSTNWNNDHFSLSFWYKRDEEGFTWSGNEVSNVMIGLSGANGSTLELGTKGGSVELYLSTLGRSERTLLGSSVIDNKWHYLTLAYDANATSGIEMEVFMDGNSIGSTNTFGGSLLLQPDDRWCFGIADPSNPTSGRFLGKLDDVRFFSKALSLLEHQVIFNGGRGDLSLTVDATYPTQTHQNPVTINLNFRKYGQSWPVDLNASQYSAPSTLLHSVTSGSASSHVLELNVTQDPAILNINLLEGLGKDDEGGLSKPLSLSLGFGRPITRLESLQAWWTFDENNGTVVNDYLGRFVGDFADDGTASVTFDTGKFGTALRFPKNAWVETNAPSAALQINGNKPRTISFWMFVESGQSGQPGPYGIGSRSCPNGTHQCWAIRSFWDGNYRRFRSQHWCWDPDVYVSEGVQDKWVHLAHIYTGTNVQVYVNGTMRRDWVK